MHRIFDVLCRLLAPILSFTADEAWKSFGGDASIHLQEFGLVGPEWRDHEATAQMSEAFDLRDAVMQEIEKARQSKVIGNSLEASVIFEAPAGSLTYPWSGMEPDLEEMMLVSSFRITPGTTSGVQVTKTKFLKCARCWRHRAYVGQSKTHPDLCDRCEAVVDKMALPG